MRREISIIKNKELSIEAAGNKITSVRDKNITKNSARIFKEGKIFSSSFVGEISHDELLERASNNKDGAVQYDYDLESIQNIEDSKTLSDKTEADFYQEYENALKMLSNEYPDFIFSGKAKWNYIEKESLYLDEGKQKISYDSISWYFVYKHKKSASMMDGYFGDGQIAKFDILSKVKEYSKYLKVFEEEANVTAGKVPIVFTSPGMLLGKMFETLRGDNYHKGIGLFKNKLGEKVLSKKFSLYDVSYDPEIGAVNLFDSEGFVREEHYLPLIEKGVFKTVISDSRNSKKYSLKKTGNGQRSFDTNSRLGFNTPMIGKGTRNSKEILEGLDQCIVVEMAAGGDFTDNGDYSTPIQGAYLLEKGVPKGRIPQVTFTSSIEKMFGEDLIEIASDPVSILDNNPGVFIKGKILIN